MTTEARFLASQVDSCCDYLEIITDSTPSELLRNIENTLRYAFWGDEKALEHITEPGFINKSVLCDVVVMWAMPHFENKPGVRKHLDILMSYLED
jgi:hypothetical protein